MNSSPTLIWGIKQSLVEYVESLEDGVIDVTEPAVRDALEFHFAFDPTASSYDEETRTGTLQFRGSVVMTGYWGAMRVEVNDPKLELHDASGKLSVRTSSVFSGERFDVIAFLDVAAHQPELTASVKLTPAGPNVFGPQYQVGQEMSELRVTW